MTPDFVTIAQRIEQNPLGRLMYGQRELFHSNLLSWFFDCLPDAADQVFRPLTHGGNDSGRWVDRERNNLDLVLHWPDRAPLVIENKVFSIPRRDQLEEYESRISKWGSTPALVVLSVSEPRFDLGPWTHVSYADLAKKIVESLPSESTYEVETMRRYSDLARDLHDLVSAVDVRWESEEVWLPNSLLDAISSNQMRAALRKARAERVAHFLNQAIPELEHTVAGKMSNATPLVEAFEYVHTKGIHVHLGWQFQGHQFRRAAVYHDTGIKGRSQESREKREAVSRERPEFFKFPPGLPQEQDGRKEFNHFAPDFVYNYVKTPHLTITELKDAALSIHQQLEGFRKVPLQQSFNS